MAAASFGFFSERDMPGIEPWASRLVHQCSDYWAARSEEEKGRKEKREEERERYIGRERKRDKER